MSRYFPQAPYAEDQQYAYTILTTHVLYRGFQTGALLGPAFALARRQFSKQTLKLPVSTYVLHGAARGSIIGTGLLTVALFGRMHGRSQIEWADRSWRLLGNKGQVEVDDFSLVGTVVGAATAAVRGTGLGWRGVVGAAAIGNIVGVGAYMGWRHGVKGGKFDDDL